MRFDYVIVGAGSAGSVLANRLSSVPGVSVLVLEAGGRDRRREIAIPAAFSKLFKTEVDWAYETEPQKHLGGRRLFWPRGKVLGGSSSINAMIYVRGHRSTFDAWADEGNDGWSYSELLPFFKRSESFRSRAHASEGSGRFHSQSGPLLVSDLRSPNRLSKAFVKAAVEEGLHRNLDFNGDLQEGVGLYHVTQKSGRRHSAAAAFLRPAIKRPGLRIVTEALVTGLRIEGGRAVGVDFVRKGRKRSATADREVILCGGAVNSPQLLLLSGIGPAADLEALDIPVVEDLPGVGENLLDHPLVAVGYQCRKKITLAGAESLGNLARYLLLGRGPLTSNVAEAGGFVRLDESSPIPNLQLYFGPTYYVQHGFGNPPGHGMTLAASLVQPKSRGRLALRSADPTVAPAIDPRYLHASEDLEVLVRGVRLARRIFRASPFDRYRGPEHDPGAQVDEDEEIRHFVRRALETVYHPVGTCKMGQGVGAVVDSELRVHGVGGLRVADASIMPTIVNGNTLAPTLAIAEKAADLILGSRK